MIRIDSTVADVAVADGDVAVGRSAIHSKIAKRRSACRCHCSGAIPAAAGVIVVVVVVVVVSVAKG